MSVGGIILRNQQQATVRIHFIVIVSVVSLGTLVSACGGGGGGGGGSPPPPAPPPVLNPVPITAQNALQVGLEAGMAIDNVYLLGLTVVNRALDLLVDGGASLVENCDGGGNLVGGTATTTNDDANGDGEISIGDTLTVAYVDECFDADLGEDITGTVQLEVSDWFTGDGTGFFLDGRATISPGFDTSGFNVSPTVSLSGQFELSAYRSGVTEIIEVRVPIGDSVRNVWTVIETPSVFKTSTVTNLTIRLVNRRRLSTEYSYEFQMKFDIASEALNGTLTCESPLPIRGVRRNVPNLGEFFECRGANQSRARVIWFPTASPFQPDAVEVFVDPDGTGTFSFVKAVFASGLEVDLPFHRTISGYVDFDYNFRFEDVANNRLTIDVTDSAFDSGTGRLYLLSGMDLVIIDSGTLTEIDRVTLTDLASTITLTDDGSRIWLGIRDEAKIQAIDAQSLQYVDDFTYSSPPPFNLGPEYVLDILALPGTNDVLVAVLQHRREMVVFSAGVELPNTIPLTVPYRDMIAFTGDGQIVSALGNQSRDAPLVLIDLDPLTGVQIDQQVPGYLGGTFLKPVYTSGNRVYVGGGRVIDLTRMSVAAKLEIYRISASHFTPDSARNRVYGLPGTNRVFVYREEPRAFLAGYEFDFSGQPNVRQVHISDTHLLITNREQVVQIALDDLVPNIRQNWCEAVDFSGLTLPGTAIQIDCLIESAVYDAVRDRLLVGLSGEAGEKGYSIAVFEPQTGNREALIPLGSQPGKMRITPDGQTLLVALPDANEIAAIDLATNLLSEFVGLGFDLNAAGDPVRPAQPTALAPGTGGVNDFVASFLNGDVGLYKNKLRAMEVSTTANPYEDMFLSQDGSTALAVQRDQSDLLDVTATGVTQRTGLGAIFGGNFTEDTLLQQMGEEIFVRNGDIFDLVTGSISRPCDPGAATSSQNLAVPAPQAGSITYVGTQSGELTVQSCNRQTGAMSIRPSFSFPGTAPGFVAGFHVANNLLALVYKEHILIIDALDPPQ